MNSPYDARPWLRFYAPGVPHEVDVPQMPVTGILDGAAAAFPRRKALAFLGGTITYRELADLVDRFAESLRRLGVRKGDRVALVLPNCPQTVVAFYATMRLGGVVVAHNPLYTVDELAHQLSDSGAKIAIVYDGAYERVARAAEDTQVRAVIVTSLVDYLPWIKRKLLDLPFARARQMRARLITELPEDADVLEFSTLIDSSRPLRSAARLHPDEDLAVLQYTGGTTGRPKGAMLTHRNLVANAYQTKAWDPPMGDAAETTLAVLPLFHVYGLTLCLTTTILAGGTLVLLPTFDLEMLFSAIDRHRPTIFPGVPPIYQQIVDSPKARKHNLRSIRSCVSGAMRLPPDVVDRFEQVTGGRLVEGYGLTESSPVALANPLNANARAGTVGIPIPGTEARIVDENNPHRILPVGVAGELLIRGPQVFVGYWQQVEETAAMLGGGWLRTGDIAVMSPDGFFTIVDRKRDVIIASGFSLYPSEIEDVIREHPAVEECGVIGMPDPYRGETVMACVVPRKGGELTEDSVVEHCAARLAAYKVPKIVELREDLPRNMLGKVLRRVLREEHGATGAGTVSGDLPLDRRRSGPDRGG